jgi:hypothetical protein
MLIIVQIIEIKVKIIRIIGIKQIELIFFLMYSLGTKQIVVIFEEQSK